MNNGKYGERLFHLRMQEQGHSVIDVSQNPEYWYKDIDFICTSGTTGNTKTFEVKWDDRINATGNLYLETESIYSKNGKGWWRFCEADYLAYGNSATKEFYIIPIAELRQQLKQIPCRWAQCGQDSVGRLVALKDIQNLIQIL